MNYTEEMTALTPADINAIIELAVKSARAEGKAGGKGGGSDRLDERYFRRVEKFTGEERGWREWSFSFRTAVGMGSVKARNALELLEKTVDDIEGNMVDLDMEAEECEKLGAELYAILTQLVTGEAMTILRGVGGDGWTAW